MCETAMIKCVAEVTLHINYYSITNKI